MQQYLDLLKKIKEDGIDSEDRTGVGTRSIFGYQMRFDLQKGFPLVTTKKVYWKGVVYELLWFLKGDTNIKYLTDHNVHIWNDWADENGDLGPVYGAGFRYAPAYYSDSKYVIDEIKIKEDLYKNYKEPEIVWYPKIDCELNTDKMWAIDSFNTHEGLYYKFQTFRGFVGTIRKYEWEKLKSVDNVDGYCKSVFGVGFFGNPGKYSKKVYDLWYNMMARCYSKSYKQKKQYENVTVSPIWHSFERFSKTISSVPMYAYWSIDELEYQLDKDYYGSNVYSPSTCVFLPRKLNKLIAHENCYYEYRGNKFLTMLDLSNFLGISYSTFRKHLKTKTPCKDVSFNEIEIVYPKDGYLFRPKYKVDQIANVINSIKTNPESRRHIISLWIPGVVEHMALPPCHAFIQFYVRNGKLSCQLYQRSVDTFLGLCFNIASYSLLTHMIAKMCDLEVGEFVWTGGDVHIYHNHFDQVDLQLTREPLSLPTLNVKVKRDKIEEYDFDDFELIDYQSYGKISAPIAV